MNYTVNELAKVSGVTIRTLHYYDEIGLLTPSRIQSNGYRTYHEKDALRLQQILFYRELEFPLEEIKTILNNPSFDETRALLDHKKLLEIKKKRLEDLIITIDKTIAHVKGGDTMTSNDTFGSFSKKQLDEYKEEAKKRWGHTDAYKQSEERTKHWTDKDYKKAQEDQIAITQAFADNSDKSPDSVEVQEVVERHYRYIEQFYDLPYEMYRNLGNMYVEDPRFTAYYEKFKPGLAAFVKQAIEYYCDQKSSS